MGTFIPNLKKVYISGGNLQSLKNQKKIAQCFMDIFGILNDIFCINIEDSGKFRNEPERSTQLGITIHIFVLLSERYI